MALLESWERETVISYSDDGSVCTMTTYNRANISKMDKLCKTHPKEYKMFNEIIFDGECVGKEYRFNKKLVTVRQPSPKRQLTDEQKKQAAERMEKARNKKSK